MSSILLDSSVFVFANEYLKYDKRINKIKNHEIIYNNGLDEESFKDYLDSAMITLLYSVILWDNIYVVEEKLASHFLNKINFFEKYSDIFKIVTVFEKEDGCKTYNKICEMAHELAEEEAKKDIYHYYDYWSVYRAFNYFILAAQKDLNYFPSYPRNEILKNTGYLNFFNRSEIIEMLDKQLSNFYSEFGKHFESRVIKFKFPVLFDYVRAEALNGEDYIDAAIRIRKSSAATKLRKTLRNLETKLNEGNFIEVNSILNEIERMSEDIIDKPRKMFDITMSISPSLTCKDLCFKKKLRIDFLFDLLDYGLNRRGTSIQFFI